jgi:hypothetical protein
VSNTKNHKRFCENDGWELYKTTDHYYYRKLLSNGEVLYTKVSMGSKEYGKAFFAMVLKQLRVNKEQFNSKI